MMKKRFSKFLAGILSAVLIFSSANYLAFAAEDDIGTESELVFETDEEEKPGQEEEGEIGSSSNKEETSAEDKATDELGETTEERPSAEDTTEKATDPEESTQESSSEDESGEEGTTQESTIVTTTEETTEEEITEEETTGEETTEEETTGEEITEEETTGEETTEEETTEEETTEEETTEEETTEVETIEALNDEEREVSAMGLLDVRIIAGIEVKKAQEFTVTLSGASGDFRKSVELPATTTDALKPAETTASFSNLSGTYTLKVAREGYETYEQEISTGDMGGRVQIYVGQMPIINDSSDTRPGLIVKNQSDHSEADRRADEIVKAIHQGIYGENYDLDKDLNHDGKVDLLDLDYFTMFVRVEDSKTLRNRPATLEAFKILRLADKIQPREGENTKIDPAQLEAMLHGNGIVSLEREDGGEISEDSPVELSLSFSENEEMDRIMIASPEDNAIEGGTVIIEYEEDGEKDVELDISSNSEGTAGRSRRSTNNFLLSNENGILQINLGGQIAVKKITLRITRTSNEALNLAEISSVQFVNGMEHKIPEPEMNIPGNVKIVPGNKSFTISWDKQNNVTAYEIEVTTDSVQNPEYRKTTAHTGVLIAQFNKDKLENGQTYKIRVRSLNGEWKSKWSDWFSAVPKVTKKPERPDYVSVTGGYRNIRITWKDVEDADTYTVFYKEDGEETFTQITGIERTSCQIDKLKDNTKYQVYITAVNELGEGPASETVTAKTSAGLVAVKLPAYKLINTSNGEGELSSHIKSAVIGGGGSMVDSPLDTDANSALGLFDNSVGSYVYREDWDYGGAYPDNVKGVTVELDAVYDIGMITFAEQIDEGSYSHCTIQYWDENGTKQKASNVSILQKTSGDRKYYLIKFKEAIRTSKLQIGVGRPSGYLRRITISEIRLYEYDSIEQDIMNLYNDDLHISLKDDVTEKTIDELQERLDTKDSVSDEYHPERDILKKELDAARELWKTGGLGGVVQVNPDITAKKDSEISVGGLNAWQPLGVTVSAGEEIVVYVGNAGMKDGDAANLQLVFTQYHSEVNKFYEVKNLRIGKNEFVVPAIVSTDSERGGALYVQYTGNKSSDQYAVRVSGGTRFPVLNLYHVTDKEERAERIAAYIEELKNYVNDLEARHKEVHSDAQNENAAYAYNAKQCVLNTTDIQMDKMMLSIPASQALAGLGSGDQEKTLADTVQAMDDMLTLFYQHKGLTNSFAEGTEKAVIEKNHLPYQYLNIRYMKMFTGAFMYASGNHIGIEWNETKGMMNGVPVVSENGKYVSGRYYGWGIAHEIGHEINQGAYAHAEVTNNYFSVLAQAKDANDTVRFQYPEVFKKVTSGTSGHAENVFTQLGMYWQLHLAYDRDYNYKTYSTYQEIFDNLFFARVDSYARNTGLAPAPDGVKLTLDGDSDQNLMRLASAAAERDLSDFFIRWGMTPNEKTRAYMKQFEPEKRAVYYVDDEARVYEMQHGSSGTFAGKNVVTAKADARDSQVTLKMTYTGDADVLQGYEITRVFVEQGKERREVCGFTQGNTFTDSVAFAANHTITYEVTAIDKFMNRSNSCRTETVKIQGDGLQDKAAWTIKTNMVSSADSIKDATEEKPCEQIKVSAAERMIDNDSTTTYTGKSDSGDPYILLELNQSTQVTALRYKLSGAGQSIAEYKVEVSEDGQNYKKVKDGSFSLSGDSTIVYFENDKDPWVCTYDAAFVRLTAVGQAGKELSISELDLYGPSGDNVELSSTENGQSGIGLLESDYVYDTTSNAKIPKGSIVFTGTYKGNPAYNVVALYDENGRIVGGEDANGDLTAHQIIIAPDPGNALLGEVSEGIWIYWFEPNSGVSAEMLPAKVRAELYRVDNAITNEGQRLVSDTKFVEVPGNLPSIQINK